MSRGAPTLRRRPIFAEAPASFIPVDRGLPLWKRAIDVAAASLALCLLAPLFAVVALAIRLDSPGPVLFRQQRLGKNGELFTCLKFRSMCSDAESLRWMLEPHNEASGLLFKLKDDPRRTRVGKVLRRASLDELPQLWNVLVGEMSLVGPRPPLPAEVEHYEPEYWKRLEGVPGITGAWQVRARHRHDFDEMLQLDLEYLSGISLMTDLRILLLTVPVVLLGRGSH